jgi:hemoglobin
MPTLFEHAGGEEALHRLEDAFYTGVLRDPLLQPLFGAGQPQHVDHLTAFTAESFGGRDRFTRELGFAHLIAVHRGLAISEEQRVRFVELYMEALDAVGMPADAAFRDAASTSSSARASRCRTRTQPATRSCIRCARSRAGPGPATTPTDLAQSHPLAVVGLIGGASCGATIAPIWL